MQLINGIKVDEDISLLAHMVGLDCKNPKMYHRHNHLFFKAVKNRAMHEDSDTLQAYLKDGIVNKGQLARENIFYWSLTEKGFEYLGTKLNCKIVMR